MDIYNESLELAGVFFLFFFIIIISIVIIKVLCVCVCEFVCMCVLSSFIILLRKKNNFHPARNERRGIIITLV